MSLLWIGVMKDPIHGHTLTFSFDDGPMAGKSFDHTFSSDNKVTFGMPGGKGTTIDGYEVAKIRDDIWVVSYQAQATLTTILDFKAGTLTAIATSDKGPIVQHGRIETRKRAA